MKQRNHLLNDKEKIESIHRLDARQETEHMTLIRIARKTSARQLHGNLSTFHSQTQNHSAQKLTKTAPSLNTAYVVYPPSSAPFLYTPPDSPASKRNSGAQSYNSILNIIPQAHSHAIPPLHPKILQPPRHGIAPTIEPMVRQACLLVPRDDPMCLPYSTSKFLLILVLKEKSSALTLHDHRTVRRW